MPGKRYGNQKYCSYKCAKTGYRRTTYLAPSQFPGLPPTTVGAINEFRVAIDLLGKGYEVFRALSPACSCDLAILRDSRFLRLEVKTAYRNPRSGHVSYPRRWLKRADHVAAVLPTEITYYPPLP
jgi:hypothetical protein